MLSTLGNQFGKLFGKAAARYGKGGAVGLLILLALALSCIVVEPITRVFAPNVSSLATLTVASSEVISLAATPPPTITKPAPITVTLTATPSPTEGPKIYVVKSGDTLFRIALNVGVTVDALERANNISDPTKLYVGQKLVIPTNTPTPRPASGLVTPTPPTTVNGVPVDQFVVISDSVRQNIRQIYAHGQALGNNPRAFSKAGDSTVENPYFLARFDGGPYNLGDYRYLQSVIDYMAGSFGRQSKAVHQGIHSWTILNPAWADKTSCQPNESPLGCEFRLDKPSYVLIRLGANDTGASKLFQDSMQKIVDYCVQNGVIPILGTKADRVEGPGNVNNTIIRKVAADKNVPLWDFDLVAQTVPGNGLDADRVHMTTFYAHDYTQPEAFQRGHSLNNLTALIALDKVWKLVTQPNQ
jgi:LysM repeat protein